jgi:hypothetical protein
MMDKVETALKLIGCEYIVAPKADGQFLINGYKGSK